LKLNNNVAIPGQYVTLMSRSQRGVFILPGELLLAALIALLGFAALHRGATDALWR
jgi:hypothetical protein